MEYVDKYRIRRLLGSGTFASVYLAFDPDLQTHCAIKVLADNWAHDEAARRWFLDEARVMFGINHPRILRVFTAGTLADGRPYFVMEYADRGSLLDRMHDRQVAGQVFSVHEAVAISLDIADGLQVAHRHGIIHRDLKPSNILLCSRPAVGNEGAESSAIRDDPLDLRLSDFGLARRLASTTNSLAGAGTPHYMAPEQIAGSVAGHPDPRSDIYAAATILYELVSGRVPFPYRSISRVVRAHLSETPPPVLSLAPNVPQQLSAIIQQGLARDPDQRFRSAAEWAGALRDFQEPEPRGPALVSQQGGQPGPAVNDEARRSARSSRYPTARTAVPDGELSGEAPWLPGDDGRRRERDSGASKRAGTTLHVRWPVLVGGVGAILLFSLVVVLAAFALRSPAVSSQAPTTTANSAASGGTGQVATKVPPTSVPAPTATLPPSAVAGAAPSPTPSPTATQALPTPTPSPTPDNLAIAPRTMAQVQTLLSQLPGLSSGLVVFPDGQTVNQSGARQTPSASLIKLWIAGAAYTAASRGQLDLNDRYTIQASDQETGTGILNQDSYVGQAIKYSDLVDIMLLYSDNTAADIVVRRVGGMDAVNTFARANGYTDTSMQRLLGQLDPNHDNYTSARDCATFLTNLNAGNVVSAAVSQHILQILEQRKANEDSSLNFFGRNLPAGLSYGHISGIIPSVRNEAGYYPVSTGGRVVVVILLDKLPSEPLGEDAIATTVHQIYALVH